MNNSLRKIVNNDNNASWPMKLLKNHYWKIHMISKNKWSILVEIMTYSLSWDICYRDYKESFYFYKGDHIFLRNPDIWMIMVNPDIGQSVHMQENKGSSSHDEIRKRFFFKRSLYNILLQQKNELLCYLCAGSFNLILATLLN